MNSYGEGTGCREFTIIEIYTYDIYTDYFWILLIKKSLLIQTPEGKAFKPAAQEQRSRKGWHPSIGFKTGQACTHPHNGLPAATL
jgi:hypothetical protein